MKPPPLAAPRLASDFFADPNAATVAEVWYAEAVRLDAEGSAAAVDAYLQCAVAAWPAVEMAALDIQASGYLASPTANAPVHASREWELYQSAVVGLLVAAQEHGRWNPATGLVAMGPRGFMPVETAYHGFVGSPAEFGELRPVGNVASAHLTRTYRRHGLGVPLVVVHNESGAHRPFVQQRCQFAATALVRPVRTAHGADVRLELYDPLRQWQVRLATGPVPLAGNFSAPLVSPGVNLRQQWLEPFLRPATGGADDRLEMIEPFQPNKIPVLLVHGLLSDPITWTDMINELQVQTHLMSRYQIWTFRYDTGAPFFTSAAALRRQLAELQAIYNPCRTDAAATNIVIVGHSMGGLIANLQVSHSGELLWNAAARVPLGQLQTDPATRAALGEAFFFDPSSDVSRVVYIGTPHLGSGWARRAVGGLGSALVEPAPLAAQRHSQLMRDNHGAFSDELTQRFPTSVDLLEPTSPLLNATARLPYRPGVLAHSIIGEGRYTLGSGPSDGVVPVTSARLVGAASETLVNARHSHQPRNETVIAEVMRILAEHTAAVDSLRGAAPNWP